MYWKEVSWILEHGWNNTSTQRKRPAPRVLTFPSGCSWVFFLSNSAIDLCTVEIKTDVARFLFDIPNNLRLCGGRETVPFLSEVFHRMLSRITANQIETKDVVMQSVQMSWMGTVRDEPNFHVKETFGATVMMFLSGSTQVFSLSITAVVSSVSWPAPT